MSTGKLTLKNMIFYGYHGVYPAEKELGQRIEVDVEAVTDLAEAALLDDLAATLDYVEIYNRIKQVIEARSYNLIETLTTAIADQLLAFDTIKRVTVRVRKPFPPLGGLLDTVEFELTKERLVSDPN